MVASVRVQRAMVAFADDVPDHGDAQDHAVEQGTEGGRSSVQHPETDHEQDHRHQHVVPVGDEELR